ncbi:hypothetical protein [Salipaludibacillus daqingensis]|uniref:hypothetical protein n=1 Tax=Salipaludibacillus daqingensis TaxID=3041001 RepID=UPI002475B31E|nr:hypothetical protein [Salipaludibacillus daqingensis]
MQRNKLIILSIGTVILTILVIVMIFLERGETTSNGAGSNAVVTDTNSSTNTASNEDNAQQDDESLNVQSENSIEEDENIYDLSEEELREKAREAIDSSTINDSETEMTKDSLYNHSLLNQKFRNSLDEETNSTEEDVEQNAEWLSIELMGWYDYAQDKYDFNYSEDQFLSFIENENYIEDEEMMAIALFEELKQINENAYIRQLETNYLKAFIWESIQDDVASEMSDDVSGMDNDNDNDENEYRLFLAFEQEIMSDLVEKNPNLVE